MLTFSPCIEMFWHDVDFPARIPRVGALGFTAWEFWSWWNKDLDAIERATKDTGLDVAACCVHTASADSGHSMLSSGGADPFVAAVKECIPVARILGCHRFIVTTGNALPDAPREEQHRACVKALRAAAPVAEDAGILLVLEPLNVLVDHAGYYLSSSAEGFQIVDEVRSPAVKLLFDVYHQQITEGNLTPNICTNIARIGHFHTANHPGRHELGRGEINYRHLLDRIRETGYDGYIGLEFSPSDAAATDAILTSVRTML